VTYQAGELVHIVSEGERRAVGLAFLLAELSTMAADSGIILDDPVSSFDDDRRQFIAERLMAEARRRQVIVFTHDLPFVAYL
jgi:wobble nucleotide-excising tRNase